MSAEILPLPQYFRFTSYLLLASGVVVLAILLSQLLVVGRLLPSL